MESNHLTSFEVSGFKKFTNLKIDDIGQFNLIIGDNNVCKTSLLEALLVDDDTKVFTEALSYINYYIRKFDNLKESFFNLYFSKSSKPFPKEMAFSLIDNDGYNLELKIIAVSNYSFLRKFETNKFHLEVNHDPRSTGSYNLNIPYIPMGFFYSHELTQQYSTHIQTFEDKKERLLKSLSFLIPQIKNIEISIADSNSPILCISQKSKNILSPLASYGEGALKFFRILLSLFANKHYSRLMIDELDAGIHYSHLASFNKSLIEVAKEEEKQIFATTHSKECIESFTKALEETGMQEKGRIIRLADTKNGIKAFTMRFEEFENALLAESEIR